VARTAVIGITCGRATRTGAAERVGVSPEYIDAVEAAGGHCVLLPPVPVRRGAVEAMLDRIDGVLVPGGADVHPRFYGERSLPVLGYTDEPRDELEIAMIRAAFKRGTPVLGICRGQQVVNVALGGSLYQDLREQGATTRQHSTPHGPRVNRLVHDVDIEPGSRYADAVRAARVRVNSRHHQAVRRVAPSLRVTAVSPDGVIEGLESDDGGVVAVQCHPEAITELEWARRLFADFVRAARR
jgi:putative glutamine amidotransferase